MICNKNTRQLTNYLFNSLFKKMNIPAFFKACTGWSCGYGDTDENDALCRGVKAR